MEPNAGRSGDRTSLWSRRMADSALARYVMPDARWHYEHGLLFRAVHEVGSASGLGQYGQAVMGYVDAFVSESGDIRTYRREEYNLDQINPGRILFPAWQATGDDRYAKALHLLRQQLREQPRTKEGAYWHKKIYPYQMWLDGVYMAGPFLAEYGRTFGEPAAFDEVTAEITLMARHATDERSGLLYHGWDESRQQPWADAQTGRSPHVWGRAMGWYAMALVDVLDLLPPDYPGRTGIIALLQSVIVAAGRVQDQGSGLWWQILDMPGREGNYEEASASCMFVYAAAKGIRLGYLPASALAIAVAGWRGILQRMISVDERGQVNLGPICAVAGLGGEPYRDGSYAYYVGERRATNDLKGVGPFILAALEMERQTDGGVA